MVRSHPEIPKVINFEMRRLDFFIKFLDTDFATIKIKDDEISSRLILGCDGANSFVRSKAGLPSFSKEYKQRGFVCTVEIDPVDENKTAYQAENQYYIYLNITHRFDSKLSNFS